jgi:hypothetical protein
MGQKYKQQGYQDQVKERNGERKRPQKTRSEGPRSPRMPGFQEVMRCGMCGKIMPVATDIKAESQCPQCGADLRSCRHCRYFDTGAQFECTQPIPKRIIQKSERNDCEFFEARTSVERQTSSPASPNGNSSPKNARSAFDDLFR